MTQDDANLDGMTENDRRMALARMYLETGDLRGSMAKLGYNLDRSNVWRIRRSDSFRQAQRAVVTDLYDRVLWQVANGNGTEAQLRAARMLRDKICGTGDTPLDESEEKQSEKAEEEQEINW